MAIKAAERHYDKGWFFEWEGHRYRFKTEPSLNKIIPNEMVLEEALTASRCLDYAEAAGFADLMEVHCRIVRSDRDALDRWIAGRQPLERLSPDTRVLETQVVAHARLLLDDAHGALEELAHVREKAEAAG